VQPVVATDVMGPIWGFVRDPGPVRLAFIVASVAGMMLVALHLDFSDRGAHFQLMPADVAARQATSVSAEPAVMPSAGPGARGAIDAQALRKLTVLSRSVSYIRTRYVDPSRVKPRAMLVSALQEAERLVPEMLVDVTTASDDPPSEARAIQVRMGEARYEASLARVEDLYEMNWKLIDVFRFVADHLPPDVKPRDVEYATVNGMLKTLDPHSFLLSPEAYEEMQMSTGGKFGGLGIQIVLREGVITIVGVFDDTPAAGAGLKKNDRILQIDEESTLNMSLNDAVTRLRGEAGSEVGVLIGREAWAEPKFFKLVRADIKIKSVEHRALEGAIGYARIKSFQTGTSGELRRALEDLRTKESLHGLVLDLRDNPGGLLDEAVKVSDLFLKTGTIVTTVSGVSRQRDEKAASGSGAFEDVPMILLVNGGSASASEIVAGALKNNNRAAVVGTQTFGKGSVQVPFEIDAAALKLTIAQYLTPGDLSIQNVGITPDIELRTVRLDKDRTVLFGEEDARAEKDLPSHLPGKSDRIDDDHARTGDKPQAVLRLLAPVVGRRAKAVPKDEAVPPAVIDELREVEEALAEEPVRVASAIVRAAPYGKRSTMLGNAREPLAALRREVDEAVEKRAGELGIDWHVGANGGKPPRPPKLEIAGLDRSGGVLSVGAGETLKVPLRLSNPNGVRLHRLHVLTKSALGAASEREVLVGRLDEGAERTVSLSLKLPQEALSRRVPVRFELRSDGAETGTVVEATLEVRGQPRPAFAFSAVLDDRAQDSPGDGRIAVGETVRLRVKIRNVGEGVAPSVVATVRNLGGEALFLREGRVTLRALTVGEEAEATFALECRKRPHNAEPTVELSVFDTSLHALRTQVMRLPYVEDPPGAAPDPVFTGRLDTPPRIELADVLIRGVETSSDRLVVLGTARYGAEDPARRFVVMYRNGTKAFYVGGDGRTDLPFEAPLHLDKGVNTITIQARTGLDEMSERTLVVFRK